MDDSAFDLDAPLRIARSILLAHLEKGVTCPCCEQHAKVYRRTLTSAMAYVAILLHRAGPFGHPLSVPAVLNGCGTVAAGGDYAKLVYWGVLAPGRSPGEYALTHKGKDFVECRIALPKAVFVYNGVLIREDPSEIVTIVDALGAKYSYDSLMSPAKK